MSDKKLNWADRKGDKPFGKSPKICNFAFATTKNLNIWANGIVGVKLLSDECYEKKWHFSMVIVIQSIGFVVWIDSFDELNRFKWWIESIHVFEAL